jgi:hypothetical protein
VESINVNGRKAGRVFLWRVALFFATLQTCVSIVSADYIPPSRVTVRTKAYQPQQTNFPRGSYEYQVSWQGVPVGSASIRIGTTYRGGKKMLDVEATARSTKVVGVFYELRHRSQSIFSAQDLKPVEFSSQQTENSRFTSIDVNFSPDGLIRAKVVKGKLNSQGKSEEVVFKSENATFDPITAAFLARSLPINPAEDLSFDIFNGQHRYLISFHVVGREKINVAGKDYEAFKVEPRVKKLTDTQGEKRLRKAYLWVSADGSREVLKLESEVFFGSVSAKLVRFVPDTSPEATAGTRLERPGQNR